MKSLAAFIFVMSFSTFSFANEHRLSVTCKEIQKYEQTIEKEHVLYEGKIPLGMLSIRSKSSDKIEYRLRFTANGEIGGKLKVVDSKDGRIPDSCIEVEPPPQPDLLSAISSNSDTITIRHKGTSPHNSSNKSQDLSRKTLKISPKKVVPPHPQQDQSYLIFSLLKDEHVVDDFQGPLNALETKNIQLIYPKYVPKKRKIFIDCEFTYLGE